MEDQALKRKRDDGSEGSPSSPVAKLSRSTPPLADDNFVSPHPPNNGPPPHVQINYLARQYTSDLPFLAPNDDTLPTCLNTIDQYDAALERSESLANNLGARPLSSVLLQRFERMFDGPPRIISSTSNHYSGTKQITWLDVVEVSDSIPADRVTEMDDPRDNSKRVVRFVAKDCELQVSWEEWQMVRSGMLQKMMPSQPVAEDEEKEMITMDILEDAVTRVVAMADQVAARGRQFNHRLRARRDAIEERQLANETTNGYSVTPVPAAPDETRAELLRLFTASRRLIPRTSDNTGQNNPTPGSQARRPPSHVHGNSQTQASPPQSANNQATPSHKPKKPPQEDGPFKPEMAARMDLLPRGARIFPPCDRCRRLRIDCLKNLTACMGCTRKHCKCSWRDVKQEELEAGISLSSPEDDMSINGADAFAGAEDSRSDDEQVREAEDSILRGGLPETDSSDEDETDVQVLEMVNGEGHVPKAESPPLERIDGLETKPSPQQEKVNRSVWTAVNTSSMLGDLVHRGDGPA